MKTVFATVPDTTKAESILNRLKAAGFDSSEISVLFADGGKMKTLIHEKHSKAAEGAAAGVGTGGMVGAVLGWLAGIGSLAIPGVGPFIAAGPILAALSGGAVGGAIGGLIGSLVGLGIPEVEAKKYETKLKEGDLFISVHARSDQDSKTAKEIFKDLGADNITESEAAAA